MLNKKTICTPSSHPDGATATEGSARTRRPSTASQILRCAQDDGVASFSIWACLILLAIANTAASPQLVRILSRGAQRGGDKDVVLTFEGQRLADAQEIFIYEPGLTVSKIEQPTDK